MQKQGELAEPSIEDLYEIGVEAKIIQLLRMPDDNYKVLIEGIKRVRIKNVVEKTDHWRALFQEIAVEEAEKEDSKALIRAIHERFAELVKLSAKIPAEMTPSIQSIEECKRR